VLPRQAVNLFLAQEGRAPGFDLGADRVTFYVMGPGEEAPLGNYWTTLHVRPRATAPRPTC
jgi:hypothetical protein